MISNLPVIVAAPGYESRAQRLTMELRIALGQLHRQQTIEWISDSARMTARVLARRVSRLGATIVKMARGMTAEAGAAIKAKRQGRFVDHAKERVEALQGTLKGAAGGIRDRATGFMQMAKNPEQLPEAVVTIVAALVTSGGIDANGGVPDLDLQFGIGAHRSIFTHSIIAGSVVEGSLYSIATLVGMTYRHLPPSHDPLWDIMDRNRERFLTAVAAGASAGVAYHLLVDGTLQPGAYHDLPSSLPIEGHGAILTANAAAEGADVTSKKGTFRGLG